MCSDLLDQVEELQLWPTAGPCVTTLLDTSPSHILASSTHSLGSLQLLDLTTKDTIFQLHLPTQSDRSSSVHHCSFLPGTSFGDELLTCSRPGGRIDVWDRRTTRPGTAAITFPCAPSLSLGTPLAYSLAATGSGGTQSAGSVHVARLSATGGLDLFDTRYPASVRARASVTTHMSSLYGGHNWQGLPAALNFTRFSQRDNCPLPCVKVWFITDPLPCGKVWSLQTLYHLCG